MKNAKILGPLEAIVAKSALQEYRGVSLGEALKVPFYLYLWLRWECAGSSSLLLRSTLRRMVADLFHMVPRFWKPDVDFNPVGGPNVRRSGRIIVICDHPGHPVQMTLGLTAAFDKEDLILVTSSAKVYESLQPWFPSCVYVGDITSRFRLRSALSYWHRFSALRTAVGIEDMHFAFQLFPRMGALLHTIDFYHQLFDSIEVSALITLSDRHWHEYVATSVAGERRIRTYTNQHGDFTDLPLYAPIASDRIFVWGQRARTYLTESGVAPAQVVVAGNPKLDHVFSLSREQRQEVREKTCNKLELRPDRLTVTLLGSGSSTVCEAPRQCERDIFESFCRACDSAVNRVVRLHPRDDINAYRAWAADLGAAGDVVFSQQDDLYEVLLVTDIASTFLSTTGLEALGFGIPVLLTNFIDGLDVEDFITFSRDAVSCRTRTEFKSTLTSLIRRPDCLQHEAERTRKIRESYFANATDGNASSVIRDFIVSERSIGANGGEEIGSGISSAAPRQG